MSISYRPATIDDNRAAYDVFYAALGDLTQKLNMGWDAPEDTEPGWLRRGPLFAHLARTADQSWLAERDGQVVGYARAIVRDGLQELTEFFVHPSAQAGGVGRELLARAFAPQAGLRRAIIATPAISAMARYLKAGVYPRFPIYNLRRAPELVLVDSDLAFVAMDDAASLDDVLARLDRAVLGHSRPVDHAWLRTCRAGFVYHRGGQPVGYGYLADDYGPFALLDPADFPAVLAHAESFGHAQGQTDMGFEVPMVNRHAVDHLMQRGYRIDPFFAHFMSDEPFGDFGRYIHCSPPFFM